MCGCLSRAPDWGPAPPPRHVSWLRIEPAKLWFTAHRVTPAMAYAASILKYMYHWLSHWIFTLSLESLSRSRKISIFSFNSCNTMIRILWNYRTSFNFCKTNTHHCDSKDWHSPTECVTMQKLHFFNMTFSSFLPFDLNWHHPAPWLTCLLSPCMSIR